MTMRIFSFNSIPLALFILATLFVATRLANAQTDEPHTFQEPGLYELEAREQEARERYAREMEALDRARQALLLRRSEAVPLGAASFDRIIPSGALGIIHVNRPREMTLLQLRGLAGSGSALLYVEDHCVSLPLRLIAGDFGGHSLSAGRAAPVRIAIHSQEVRAALLRGDDVISDLVDVSHGTARGPADLVLLDGLTLQHGFVINPGRSLIDDVFGVQGTRVPCPS